MKTFKFLASVALAFLVSAVGLSLFLVILTRTLSPMSVFLILYSSVALSAAVWLPYILISGLHCLVSRGRTWPQPINGLDLGLTLLSLGSILLASLGLRGSFAPTYTITAAAVDAHGTLWVATSSSRYGRNKLGSVRKVTPEGRLTEDFKTGDLSREGMSRVHLIPHASGAATALLGHWGSQYGSVSGRLIRLASDGKVDPSFSKDNLSVSQLAARPDGSLWLTVHSGTEQAGLIEVSPTGQTIRELPLPSRIMAERPWVSSLAIDNDALLVAVAMSGTLGAELLRLKADGAWDEPFSKALSASLAEKRLSVKSIRAVLPHGQGLLLIGHFDSRVSFETFNAIRITSAGGFDPAFAPFRYPAGGESLLVIGSVAVAPDRSILLGGKFNRQYVGNPRGLYRFLPDGRPDGTFTQDWIDRLLESRPDGDVQHIAPLPDGRFYAAGVSVARGGRREPFLFRLQPDGSLDGTFVSEWTAGLLKRPFDWRDSIFLK